MLGCTRCGNTSEGEEITIHNTFAFPHADGCGQGVGPIFLLPDKVIKPKTKSELQPVEGKLDDTIFDEAKPKKSTPKTD